MDETTGCGPDGLIVFADAGGAASSGPRSAAASPGRGARSRSPGYRTLVRLSSAADPDGKAPIDMRLTFRPRRVPRQRLLDARRQKLTVPVMPKVRGRSVEYEKIGEETGLPLFQS